MQTFKIEKHPTSGLFYITSKTGKVPDSFTAERVLVEYSYLDYLTLAESCKVAMEYVQSRNNLHHE